MKIGMNNSQSGSLILPYGGRLVDLLVSPDAHDQLKTQANHLPSVQLSERSACDLEMLAAGAFSRWTAF